METEKQNGKKPNKWALPFIVIAVALGIWIIGSTFTSSPGSQTPTVNRESRPRSTSNSTEHWFSGGNLHNATYREWKNASNHNKLATAADWLAATDWVGHLNSPGDVDRLKIKAQMLVDAIDKVVNVDETGELDSLKVTEIAAMIMTLANDLGP